MKTRVIKFTYGTVKDASLTIPAQDFSIMDVVKLIQQSYLEWAFRPGCGLMSDEVLVSSIGHSNFFAGALGGYETRLNPETFKLIKEWCENDMSMAVMVAQYCEPGCTLQQAYIRASKNEVLSESDRRALVLMAELSTKAAVAI